MRADRLLTMMMLLQKRGCMSARELAEQLEVSKRTIYRDVDALSLAGVPVYTQPGARGGILLDEDYRVSLTGLDRNEVLALFASGKTGPLQDLGLESTFEDALLKLFTALPSIHRREVEWLKQRVHVDPTDWFQISEPLPFFELAQKAVWENRIIEGEYYRSDGKRVERKLEAYGLVAKRNIWYLVGRKEDGAFRSYRIFRFRRFLVTDQHFEHAPDFDLALYWESACRAYEEYVAKDHPPMECRLQVHAAVMWYFDSVLTGKFEEIEQADQRQWRTLQVRFNSFQDAAAMLPGLGSNVIVLEPETLRDEIRSRAEAILASFQSE